MIEPAGVTESSLANNPGTVPVLKQEPEVEHPRASNIPPALLSAACPLPASNLDSLPSPLPPSSGQHGDGGCTKSGPFQTTVETAPPTPVMQPVRTGRDTPAAVKLEESRDERHGNQKERHGSRDQGHGGRGQDSPADMREPPALLYMQPSPEQIRRGEPLTGWLCEPGWFRRRIRDFTPGNIRGNQQ